MNASPYPPIDDYGYISDCHSAALVSRTGSIDWCCMPHFDSRSCFGRLLDWERGGYFSVTPEDFTCVKRTYVGSTLVLETTYRSGDSEARVLDCITMREKGQHHPHRQLLRIVEGVRGRMEFRVDVVPRFDFGSVKPWIRCLEGGGHLAVGGNDGLFISGDVPLEQRKKHCLAGSFTVRGGERRRLSILWRPPEELEEMGFERPTPDELDRRLEETLQWWRFWSRRCTYSGPHADHVLRSAIVLKGLTNAPTGAIVAAPTTSLPEVLGGSRNWDYRFSWIRDSSFAVRSLAELGYEKEADGFRRFVERSAAGSVDQLQILYGIDGGRRLIELDIGSLEGYRGASPVRTGNAAECQSQFDMFGEILDLAWRWHSRDRSPDADYWGFLVEVVNKAAERWKEPDRSIWELRVEPRHFVHSKVMCWVALDRGIALSEDLELEAPLESWRRARDEIRRRVESDGYDTDSGTFIQAFGHPVMDAALLLLPSTGFIDHDDERMVRTVKAVQEELLEGGFLRRYPPGDDGMQGREGAFLACSFWLVECLARQGKCADAAQIFERVLNAGNDLLLFSEEYDTVSGEMLGNFPQGLTHLSMISAAIALEQAG